MAKIRLAARLDSARLLRELSIRCTHQIDEADHDALERADPVDPRRIERDRQAFRRGDQSEAQHQAGPDAQLHFVNVTSNDTWKGARGGT